MTAAAIEAGAPDHDPGAEAGILGGILLCPGILDRPELDALEPGHFYDLKHQVVFAAMRNLRAANRPIDVVTVEGEITHAGHLEATGGVAFLGELSCRVPTVDNAIDYVRTVQMHARNRQAKVVISEALTLAQQWSHDPSELVSELRAELDRKLAKLEAGSTTTKPCWHRASDLVDEIASHASDPWARLTLGSELLAEIRAGGNMVVMGPTGSGKSSLVGGLLIEYTKEQGPVVVLSRELPAIELTARVIGMQCDASWPDVLRGQVRIDDMRRAASSRMFIVDRKDATIPGLVAMIRVAQAEHRGKLVLVAVDYVQIVESKEGDPRARVADVIAQIDDVLRDHGCVGISISQMSRAKAREARGGDALGADSTDGGAESAAIERTATVTLSIGKSGPMRDDGTCTVELNIGKHRMGGGDKVRAASYDGRTGRWRLTGEARSAAEVKAEREGQRDSALAEAALRAMVEGAEAAPEPVTRAQLEQMAVARMGKCSRLVARAALAKGLAAGQLAEVRLKPAHSRAWLIWPPGKAAEAGIPLANGGQS